VPHTHQYLERCFLHFAKLCDRASPLYAGLSRRVAKNAALRALVARGTVRQPPPNLLFGAVHFLLLNGEQHRLAEFYPSVGGRCAPAGAYAAFADFCRRFERPITQAARTQRVQTNEVGRCGPLLPAFTLAWERYDRRPLFLIEVGCSAGLNLLFDRYQYEYTGRRGRSCGLRSPARIRTELRGRVSCPIPEVMPQVQECVGIDIAPVDVKNAAEIRWLEAMIWPDQLQRLELFRAAAALARAAPPRLIRGDALQVLPQIVRRAPVSALVCVFHSHATYQMSAAWRREFERLLADLGRGRALVHISLEWLGDDPGPRLHLTDCSDGKPRRTHLADCHHHGFWIEWLAG
jgi:hypothetical protein